MSLLGLATAEGFRRVDKWSGTVAKSFEALDRRLRNLEKRPAPIEVPQTINLAGESVSLEELLKQLLEQVRPLIESQLREAIEEALRAMDWQDLTDRAWEAVDVDQLTEKLTVALIEKVTDLVDREKLRDQLVETLLDDFDLDDLANQVTSALSDRLEVRLKPQPEE